MNNPNDNLPRPRLSVAMIVRNAEDALVDAIESVRCVADEIVIVDTTLSDKITAIAERLGAKQAKMPREDDLAAARNACLELATGDWIVWIDAWERLTASTAADLRAFLDANPDRRNVYSLWVEMPARDGVGAAEQILQPRLMPAKAELRFEGRIRETLDHAIRAAGMGQETAPGRILKDPRQYDLECTCERAEHDLSLALLEGKELGENPARLRLVAGDACIVLGEPGMARASFCEAICTAEQGSREMLEAYYGLLAASEGDSRLGTLRLDYCREALEVFPLDIQLLLTMGNQLLSVKRLDLAIRSFEAACQIGKATPEVWHLIAAKEVAATCLALALESDGRKLEACQVLETAVSQVGSLNLKNHLFNLCVRLGNTEQALALADELPCDDDQREPFRNAIRGACKAAQQEWTAALGYLQAAQLSGCNSAFCLRWLAVTLLSNGAVDAARPVLEQWQSVEPDNAELRAYLSAVAQLAQENAAEGGHGEIGSAKRAAKQHVRIDHAEASTESVPPPIPAVSPHPCEVRKIRP